MSKENKFILIAKDGNCSGTIVLLNLDNPKFRMIQTLFHSNEQATNPTTTLKPIYCALRYHMWYGGRIKRKENIKT